MKQEIRDKIKANIHDFDKRLESVFKRLTRDFHLKNIHSQSLLQCNDNKLRSVQEKTLANHSIIIQDRKSKKSYLLPVTSSKNMTCKVV
jgi:hypothetical protein